jgi:tRNA pseudouridine13 synthase
MDEALDIGLPCITEDTPGIGGEIKTHRTDFRVQELPRYEASGSGTHVYLLLEKQGLTTPDALARIASALHLQRKDIGYAGRKDAFAVTQQWISIEHIDPQAALKLDLPGIKILSTQRHTNKLRLGHLAGNRFVLRVRHLELPLDQAVQQTQAMLALLQQRGVPNYFGPQRFGKRNDGQHIGRAILHDDRENAMDILLGRPISTDPPAEFAARQCYDQGDFDRACATWPDPSFDKRPLLRQLLKNGGKKGRALRFLNHSVKRFYVSAFQSAVFNQVLAARMPRIDTILTGDMAYKHANGACFLVEDSEDEQARCTAREISPTGPLFGPRMAPVKGPAHAIENPIVQQHAGELLNDPKALRKNNAQGGRRPLRFIPRNTAVASAQDEHGAYLELRFDLDPGCYATVLMQEIMGEKKSEVRNR